MKTTASSADLPSSPFDSYIDKQFRHSNSFRPPKNTKSEHRPNGAMFAQSTNWLPDRNTRRTNSKTVSEVISWYYKYYKKTKTLYKGQKPEFLPNNRIITQREMRHYLYLERYDNPIEKAREMHRILKAECLSQNKLSKKLGISRVRVTQLLNLLKLSPEQQEYIIENGREQQITERALRKHRLSR